MHKKRESNLIFLQITTKNFNFVEISNLQVSTKRSERSCEVEQVESITLDHIRGHNGLLRMTSINRVSQRG